MIQFNDVDKKIKEDIDDIFSGEYDEFIPEIENLKKLSFMYNHLELEDNCLIFRYGEVILKASFSDDLFMTQFSAQEHICYHIQTMPEFESAYKIFCRDYKINGILKDV